MSRDRQDVASHALDRSSTLSDSPPRQIVGVPKYQQLADALREQIDSGAMPAGSLIPSDAELVTTYGVSPTTARHAIRALRDAGLVITYHGRGSFVRHRNGRATHTIDRAITTTGVHHRDAGPDVDGEWSLVEDPSTYRIEANADLALALGIPEHSPIFGCDRLLSARDGRRISHRLYIPFAVAAGSESLKDNPFREPTDLYDILAAAHGRLTWTETVTARVPTPDDTNTLRLPAATPLLIVRRTTRNPDRRPLALEDTHLAADDTQLAYTITAARRRPAR